VGQDSRWIPFAPVAAHHDVGLRILHAAAGTLGTRAGERGAAGHGLDKSLLGRRLDTTDQPPLLHDAQPNRGVHTIPHRGWPQGAPPDCGLSLLQGFSLPGHPLPRSADRVSTQVRSGAWPAQPPARRYARARKVPTLAVEWTSTASLASGGPRARYIIHLPKLPHRRTPMARVAAGRRALEAARPGGTE